MADTIKVTLVKSGIGKNKKIRVESLVMKVKEGDHDAFSELYDIFIDQIYRYVFYRVKSTDAEVRVGNGALHTQRQRQRLFEKRLRSLHNRRGSPRLVRRVFGVGCSRCSVWHSYSLTGSYPSRSPAGPSFAARVGFGKRVQMGACGGKRVLVCQRAALLGDSVADKAKDQLCVRCILVLRKVRESSIERCYSGPARQMSRSSEEGTYWLWYAWSFDEL